MTPRDFNEGGGDCELARHIGGVAGQAAAAGGGAMAGAAGGPRGAVAGAAAGAAAAGPAGEIGADIGEAVCHGAEAVVRSSIEQARDLGRERAENEAAAGRAGTLRENVRDHLGQ